MYSSLQRSSEQPILLGLLVTYEIGPPHHFAHGSLLSCAAFRAALISASLTKAPRTTIPGGLGLVARHKADTPASNANARSRVPITERFMGVSLLSEQESGKSRRPDRIRSLHLLEVQVDPHSIDQNNALIDQLLVRNVRIRKSPRALGAIEGLVLHTILPGITPNNRFG
jgi:hypothetical protein